MVNDYDVHMGKKWSDNRRLARVDERRRVQPILGPMKVTTMNPDGTTTVRFVNQSRVQIDATIKQGKRNKRR